MRRTVFRATALGAVAAFAALVATSAFGQSGHARFGGPAGLQSFRGLGPAGGMFGGPGFGGPGGRPGRSGLLAADVLTPAAAFLATPLATLVSDLNSGKTLAQEATAKGKTASDLVDAIVAALKTNLDNQKAAGWVTADQETAALARLKVEVTELVDNGPRIPSEGGHAGAGPLQAASTFLGMSVPDILSALQSGKTLADLATAKGKTAADLVTALLAPEKTKLDQAVKDGKLTQAQETTILGNLTTRLTDFVDGKRPTPPQMGSHEQSALNGVIRTAMLHGFGRLHH
jgi:hypothetical protein